MDLWGVVHDGINPYLGVVDAMRKLKSYNKKIILLSNSPRRSSAVKEQIEGIGIPNDAYDYIISSGELVFKYLNKISETSGEKLYYKISPKGKDFLTDRLIDRSTSDINKSDYVLLIGPVNDENDLVEDYIELLKLCLKRSLKIVCANPDLSVIKGNKLVLCAGSIAEKYHEIGGEVILLGKPHYSAYNECFKLFPQNTKNEFIAIGDSPLTDIKGANSSGIDSVFIMNGMHKNTIYKNNQFDLQLACNLFKENNIDFPTAFMEKLIW